MPESESPKDTPGQAEIVFGDGGIDDKGIPYIASFLTDPEYENTPHTRMWTLRAGQWLYRDLDTIVKSAIRAGDPSAGYALGQDGVLSIARPGDFRQEYIADAGTGKGKYGYVNRIRLIAGNFYVCGHAGQVYRRTSGGWVHMDDGLLKPAKQAKDAISLYDIDGTGEDDIYVCGLEGILAHYNGSGWTRLDSPTDDHLERVHCVSAAEVYLCGGSEEVGRLFVGSRDKGWQEYNIPTGGGFWGLTVFKGTPYVCSQDRLFSLVNDDLVEIKPDLDPPIRYFRLVSNAEIMWSIGNEHLATFDGLNWERVHHPDAG